MIKIPVTPHIRSMHDDVIKWKYFPRYWPFVREIHRSPVNFPHKGQWRGALMFTLICARKNGWVNNGEAGDLRRYLAHYDVIVMVLWYCCTRKYNFSRNHYLWRSFHLDHSGISLQFNSFRDYFHYHGLTLIPAWICNHMLSKMWDDITYPFSNFNGANIEIWEWISDFIPHFIMDLITCPCWA